MQRTKQGKLSGRSAGLSVGRRSLQKGGGGGEKIHALAYAFALAPCFLESRVIEIYLRTR